MPETRRKPRNLAVFIDTKYALVRLHKHMYDYSNDYSSDRLAQMGAKMEQQQVGTGWKHGSVIEYTNRQGSRIIAALDNDGKWNVLCIAAPGHIHNFKWDEDELAFDMRGATAATPLAAQAWGEGFTTSPNHDEIVTRLCGDEFYHTGTAINLDAVAPAVLTWLQEARAQAWDDGFTANAHEHTKQYHDPSYPINRVNPYRG